jgi:hypothetical protein
MKRMSLLFFALASAAPLLSGCNATTTTAASTTTTTPSLTGNWEFNTLYPGPSPQNIIYVGALTTQGTAISGVLRTNTCFSATQDIAFSGSLDAKGNLSLTSSNLSGNVVNLTATLGTSTGTVASGPGTLAITGSTPCAPVTASIYGNQFAPLTGTFAGTMSSTSSATVTATATLTQSTTANSDGLFTESGTLNISAGGGCGNTFPVSGYFAGSPFSATLTSNSGPPATATFNVGVPYGNAVSASVTIVSTCCAAGSFAGNLTKQ